MHRATPLMTSFRAFSAGGARSVVDKVNDGTLMQEMLGNFMKGETRGEVESPQNYGFSSVVLPAKKGKGGLIEESAEAFIGFMGGNRSFPVALVMDDRRHRPMGLKPGENSQYDDIGQMTLMRRNGLYLLTLDSEDESQSQSGGGGSPTATQQATSGGGQQGGQKVERMVSLRHVEKKKQERQKQGQQQAAGGGQQQNKHEDFKHEGESVNTEVRCTKNRIEFRTGEKVVGYYDVKEDTWFFTGKLIHNKATSEVKDEAPKISHN
jgi:uncharacterized FlaG/YvyC family protein